MKKEHAELKKAIIEQYGEDGALDALITLYQLKKLELDNVLAVYGHQPSPSALEVSNDS